MRMQCPKCREGLSWQEHDGFAGFICGRCGGLWLKGGELEATVRASAAQVDAPLRALRLLPGVPQPTAMRCPVCVSAPLERLTLRAVPVERCPRCQGVFLEPGEAEVIVERTLRAHAEVELLYQELMRTIDWQRRAVEKARQAAADVPPLDFTI